VTNDPCRKCSYSPTLPVLATYSMRLELSAVSQNRLKGRTSDATQRIYSGLRNKFLKLMTPQAEAIPQATDKRRVTFTRVYGKRKKAYDSDNFTAGMKGARDGLTKLGLIKNDNAQWLEAHYQQVPGDDDCVIITIEDIQWNPPKKSQHG
jgi:Holliday junction resolvase RusA-like endonuclease